MSSGQKAAFSFLTALVLFAGFVFFAHTGLMAQIETKFYAQAKIGEKNGQLEKLAQSCNSYISNILTKIQTGDDAYLKSSAVRTYAHQTPSEKDATDRKNLTARLFDDLSSYGFEGMRLIEKNGRTLHYSSYESDVLKRVSLSTTYKLYSDVVKDSGELDGESLLVNPDNPQTRFLLDRTNNRIVISFPFFITDNTYFATLVCYFGIHDFEQYLLSQEIIRTGDSLIPVTGQDSYDGGFVLNLPVDSRSEFFAPVIAAWKKSGTASANSYGSLERILEKSDGSYWLLMTSPLSGQFKVSAVYSSSLFELPREMEYLIYICVFMTLLLVCSLLFNIKRDYLTIIKTRIKKVQFGIINEYLENKEKIEWSQIARQLENRKAELSEEIKKAVGGKSNKYSKQVDAYLDSSWEDIIGILKAQNSADSGRIGGATIEEIRRVIEDVLRNSRLNVNVAGVAAAPAVEPVEAVEEAEAVEEIEEIEDAEAVEEIEEIEDAEAVEEIEEIEDAEAVEEIEEIEDAEAVEEIEEIEDAEEVEEIEEAEPVEEIEEVEEVEEVEEIEELQSVEDFMTKTAVTPASHFVVTIEDPDFYEDLKIGLPTAQEEEDASEPQITFIAELPHFVFEEEAPIPEPVEEVEEVEAAEPAEEIEEIEDAEELPKEPYFAMTRFGQNEQPVVELRGEGDTIVEHDGVYSIADNLSYTKVFLNQEFKTLVDSVLQN